MLSAGGELTRARRWIAGKEKFNTKKKMPGKSKRGKVYRVAMVEGRNGTITVQECLQRESSRGDRDGGLKSNLRDRGFTAKTQLGKRGALVQLSLLVVLGVAPKFMVWSGDLYFAINTTISFTL